MGALVDALRAAGLADVGADVPLAELTTLRVGGPAAALVTVESSADLLAVSEVARRLERPVAVIGRGSNVLAADSGWPGIVVRLGRGLRGCEVSSVTGDVVAGGAEPLPTLAVTVTESGFTGFAWAVGVPGTVGGAVRMNAGAHGRELADDLVAVEVVRLSTGEIVRLERAELGLGYRASSLASDDVVTCAELHFERGDVDALRRELATIRSWRREHQPINEPSCGSVFTNPASASAGALIEAAGCKGERIGGAEVSVRHANFIVTRPGASASDVSRLIDRVRDRVRDHAGVVLTPEVVRLGDFNGPERVA